jgi:hypothetical protein
MYAFTVKVLETGGFDNDSMATYTDASITPTAFFLTTAGSEKYSTTGAGAVTLNSKNLYVLLPGLYFGTTDIKGIPFTGKSAWTVTGSSLVPAFSDSLNEFVTITGVKIPKWTSVSKDKDLTITLIGNTTIANDVYAELEINGTGSDSKRYLSKSLTPGTLTCTFTSAELKSIANYSPSDLGVTLRLFGYKYKKVDVNSKAYYIVNETFLTHAIYWAR